MLEENIGENLLSKEEQEIIVRIFEDTSFEYPVVELLEELKNNGYSNVEEMILCAIYDNILDVSNIEEDGKVYMGLGMEGESMWKELDAEDTEDVEDVK